ncbi:hypothetical protein, partial [Xanthomonas hortorum]
FSAEAQMTVDDYKCFIKKLGMELRRPNFSDPDETQKARWVLIVGENIFTPNSVTSVDIWVKSTLREELGVENAIHELRKIYDCAETSQKNEMVRSFCSNVLSRWFDPQLRQVEREGRIFSDMPRHWRALAIEKLGGRMHLAWCPLWMRLRNALLDWELKRKEDEPLDLNQSALRKAEKERANGRKASNRAALGDEQWTDQFRH